ncbi:hypothetical protein GCM10027202_17620 [Microvirgula curvata]
MIFQSVTTPTNDVDNVIQFQPRTRPEDSPPMLDRERPAIGKLCHHHRVMVDEAKANVTCRDCGEKLNPVWVLSQMAKKESWQRNHIMDMHRAAEKAASKLRCKCEHCGHMTRIAR